MLHECGLGDLEDMSPADRDGYLRDTLWEAREYDPAAFRSIQKVDLICSFLATLDRFVLSAH